MLGGRRFPQLTNLYKRKSKIIGVCEHYAARCTFLAIPIYGIYVIKIVKIILEHPVYFDINVRSKWKIQYFSDTW